MIFHHLMTALDIILVYSVIYQILVWTWTSHAFKLIKGLFIVLCIYLISHILGLTMLNWILGKFATILILMIIIIFQLATKQLLGFIMPNLPMRRAILSVNLFR